MATMSNQEHTFEVHYDQIETPTGNAYRTYTPDRTRYLIDGREVDKTTYDTALAEAKQ